VNSPADLRPGDLGFGPIHGAAGALVNAGQLLLGEGFHVGRLDIRHVFVVVDVQPGLISLSGDETDVPPIVHVVEAMPSGACEVWMTGRWTPEYAYVRLPEDYPGQAEDAAAIARAMIGTPYSFASYAALAAWRFGLKAKRLEAWIDRRQRRKKILFPGLAATMAVELPCEAICSVLADQAWSLTGKKIMEGVAHQCVTPGALAARLLEMEGAEWIWPSKTGS
jgi:hypothetical protein